MELRCTDEVHALHGFFQRWFTGEVHDTDDNFRRFEHVIADDFYLVSPRGHTHDRAEILRIVRGAHGGRAPEFRIQVKECRVRVRSPELWIVTYQEWHLDAKEPTARHATAAFRPDDRAPLGVTWVHVHETWMQGQEP